MKRIFKLLTFTFVAFLLTGCIKYNINIDIKDENTKTYKMTMLVQESTLKSLGQTVKDLKNNVGSNSEGQTSWTTKEISETIDGEKYVGYEYTASGSTKDQLKVTKKVKDGKTTYTLKLDAGDIDNSATSQNNQLGDYGTLKKSGAEMKITISMPGKIIKTNVGKADKNKVTIDLLDMFSKKQQLGNIEVVSSEAENDNTALYLGLGVGVIVIVACAAIIIIKKKKVNAKKIEAVNDESIQRCPNCGNPINPTDEECPVCKQKL